MEIRWAKPLDTVQILGLLDQIGQLHHQLRSDMFRENAQKFGASQVLSRLDDPKRPTFVAVEGEKVLGYAFCELKTANQHPVLVDHTTLYMDDLCVDEACRRQGVGKALYAHILSYAKEQGCKNVTLNVWCCNEAARKFYESVGMVPQRVIMEAPTEGS